MSWSPHTTRTVSVLAGLVVAFGLGGSWAATSAAPPASRANASSGPCPRNALRLPAAGVARAAEQALKQAASDYPGVNTHGARVEAADRSAFAGPRGGEVRSQCGAAVARRSVVVQMVFPKMLPSASLSEGVVFVARFAHGYRVWEVAH
jgi:hypothetical protein